MKHLNANLDGSDISLELLKDPNGDIRAVGVDADGDVVAIPGVVHGSGDSIEFVPTCEFHGVLGTVVNEGVPYVTFENPLVNMFPAGATINLYEDNQIVGGLLIDDAVVFVTVIVESETLPGAVVPGTTTNGIPITTESFLAITPAQNLALGTTQLADCNDIAVNIDGPNGGNLCVTGNLLVGGSVTDKDGNDIFTMDGDDIILGDGDGDIGVDGDLTGGNSECVPIMGTDLISVIPAQITNQGSTVIKIAEGSEEDYLAVGETITFFCGDDTFDGEITDVQVATDTVVTPGDTIMLDYTTVAGINSYNPQAQIDLNGLQSGVLTLATTDGLQVGDILVVPPANASNFNGETRLTILYLLDDGTNVGVQYSSTLPIATEVGLTVPTGITFTAVRETSSSTTTITECLNSEVDAVTTVEYTGGEEGFANSGFVYGHNVLFGTGNPATNGFGAILDVTYNGTGTRPTGWGAGAEWNLGWGPNPYTGSATSDSIVDSFRITDQIFDYWNDRLGSRIPQL